MGDELISLRSFDEQEDEHFEDDESLIFDEDIVRDEKDRAVIHPFDKSIALLDQEQKRPLFPAETHNLLIAGLEGKLSGREKRVYESMEHSEGEWINIVFENKHPFLFVHYFPKNVVWLPQEQRYDCSQLKSIWKRIYNLQNLPESGAMGLWMLHEQGTKLLPHLFSRPFQQLPRLIQEYARVWIPPIGTAWPMARAGFKQYGVIGGPSYALMATRGVKQE